MPWGRRLFRVSPSEYDPYRRSKEVGNTSEGAQATEQSTQLTKVKEELNKIHDWRKKLSPLFRGSDDNARSLDAFTEPFISVCASFDVLKAPFRKYLEKTRGANLLSTKGLLVQAEKDRFRLSPRISGKARAYLREAWEEPDHNLSAPDFLIGDSWLDAPFAYALEFRNSNGVWEVISLAAAIPDFENKSLIVRQLQGSGGIRSMTPEAKEARSRFNTATCIPFVALGQLAHATGLNHIKLIKSGTWEHKTRGGSNSPYTQISARFHMNAGDEEEPYYSVETNELLKEA